MTQWQTPVLLPESVRLALVQQYIQMFGDIPDDEELAQIEKVVKYIYQSK